MRTWEVNGETRVATPESYLVVDTVKSYEHDNCDKVLLLVEIGRYQAADILRMIEALLHDPERERVTIQLSGTCREGGVEILP